MLKLDQNLHLYITSISHTFFWNLHFYAIMRCNTAGNPVRTFLLLSYFHRRFGSSFWGEQKNTRSSNNTAASAKTQNSPSLRHEVLWIRSARSHQATHLLLGRHDTQLVFSGSSSKPGRTAHSLRSHSSALSPILPPAAPLAKGIRSTHLGLQAGAGPRDRSRGRCSRAHQSSPALNRTAAGNTRSLPVGRPPEPRSASLTLLHLRDLTGAILSICWDFQRSSCFRSPWPIRSQAIAHTTWQSVSNMILMNSCTLSDTNKKINIKKAWPSQNFYQVLKEGY